MSDFSPEEPASPPPGGPSASVEPEKTPSISHAWLEGVRLFRDGDYAGARRKFQALLLSHPEDSAVQAACGHAFLHENSNARALEHYQRAEALSARPLPEVLYNRALIALRGGELPKARDLLTRLLELAPAVASGSFYLGLLFDSTNEFHCDVCLYLGQIELRLDRMVEAGRAFQQALELQPGSVTALQALGDIAIAGRHYVDAIRTLSRILELSSLEEDHINAHNSLGMACYSNGMGQEAIDHFTWVLRHSPGNPTAIRNLHDVYEREGVFERDGAAPAALRRIDQEEGALPIFHLAEGTDLRAPEGMVVIGKCAEMLRVMRHARVAAASDSPVLIRGEGGSGKELLARLIGRNSARREGPFLVVNCGNLPELQLEAELFGYEKGAFTGARARKVGALEAAAGGTLFLDEVAALQPLLQGRLFRALQEGRYLPMGGARPTPIDVRVIAATQRDLSEAMRQGTFREDLYYLLNVVHIHVPALRERREDIPLLVEYFLRRHARAHRRDRITRFAAEDLQILQEYEWPGNVRELENLIERAVVMGSKSSLYLEELARLRHDRVAAQRRGRAREEQVSYPAQITLADLEKRHILSVLELSGNNQRQAARVLGINPSTLWRKLKSYGVSERQDDEPAP